MGNFGGGVAVGDINRDGTKDLLVGADDSGYNGRNNSGSMFVLMGLMAGWAASSSANDYTLNGTTAIRFDGAEAGDRAGWPPYIADVTGDGMAELITSAYAPAGIYGGDRLPGAIYVYFAHSPLPWDSTVDLNNINE